jgi:penicillin-binding protein 2
MRDSQPLRLSILGIVAVALFTALLSRLWFLQVMAAPEYQAEGEANRTRTVVVEGPRGRVLDRNGVVLADNRESVVVTVDAYTLDRTDDADAVLAQLVTELNAGGVATTVDDVHTAMEEWNGDPFRPIVVAEDVPHDLYYTLSEKASTMPGVGVEMRLERMYPYGTLAAHVLGYVGEINEAEMAAHEDDESKPYQLGDTIGKAGVEAQYESQLRGTPGSVTFEIDPLNRIVSIVDEVQPQPGYDLQLTIDSDIQGVVERALETEILEARTSGETSNERPVTAPGGAAVIEDPQNGQILAMASYPTFDPNELTQGVSAERYQQLATNCAETQCALRNRAIQDGYAPGSTFKPFSGYAAAIYGIRDPRQHWPDPGSYTLKPCDEESGRCTFYNAGKAPHGQVDMRRALAVSSNVYFFGVGESFARHDDPEVERGIQTVAESFGFGEATGVPLPLENGGYIGDAEYKLQRHEENPEAFPYGRWEIGDTVNLAIGQGELGVTPLQLANGYATLGNGGSLYAPNIALALIDPATGEPERTFASRTRTTLELDGSVRQVLLDGLVGVTTDGDGTATRVFAGMPQGFAVAGKTGTAQVGGRASSSVFAGFAPLEKPRYSWSIIIEQGGYGSAVAAPTARRILEPLALRDTQGIALPTTPLPGQEVEGEREIEIQESTALD